MWRCGFEGHNRRRAIDCSQRVRHRGHKVIPVIVAPVVGIPPVADGRPNSTPRRKEGGGLQLSSTSGLFGIGEPTSGCPRSKPSGKVRDTHSVGSICDHDFGVFTVTNIATENTDAVPPAHPVSRMPKPANQGLQRCRGPRVSLTCLAPLAAWQSLCTGHVDASLENFVADLNRREPPERR